MGVVQSSVSSEVAVAGALVAGGVAYSVYRRVASDDQAEKRTSSGSDSEKTVAASSGKKGKGKKKSAGAAGNKQTRGNDDAELDELVARARAEQDAKQAETEARLSASKGGIPGAFDRDATTPSSEAESKEKKTRKKGKKAAAATPRPAASSNNIDSKEAPASSTPVVPPTQESTPVPATTEQAGTSKKQKKRKGAKADPAAGGLAGGAPSSSAKASQKPSGAASMQSSQMMGMSVTLSDAPDDASWTRVSTRKKGQAPEATQTDPELMTSDTNLTSGVTDPEYTEEDEGSVQEPENRRTFAERMLPRPRKTGVEDMEDEPLQPALARVMRVKPAGDEKPANGFSWGDYENAQDPYDGTSADGDADDVWEEVKSKKKKFDRPVSGMASSADSLPLGQRSAAQEPTSKRQRQNAERRDAAKAEKDAQEKERLERLARHKRELERSRIAEQYSSSSSKKNISGGMKASVDGGKLVWE